MEDTSRASEKPELRVERRILSAEPYKMLFGTQIQCLQSSPPLHHGLRSSPPPHHGYVQSKTSVGDSRPILGLMFNEGTSGVKLASHTLSPTAPAYNPDIAILPTAGLYTTYCSGVDSNASSNGSCDTYPKKAMSSPSWTTKEYDIEGRADPHNTGSQKQCISNLGNTVIDLVDSKPSFGLQRQLRSIGEDSDSDCEISTHPNKFPIEIEDHCSRSCRYARHVSRSGPKIKQRTENVYNQYTGHAEQQIQTIKYYQKELVRICHCGRYENMEGALQAGRTNDCNGYEIHYSQKCKWKAYEDFKTKKRVLIRLCKCYKP